ncbi:MAG TPA: ATP-dependent DNA helicase RecG [Ktedonobacteraceae bacterium]|nr:ATP-dependent DNA helicase RecG [Ktedonobacteraceae bacterium]
MSNTLDSSITSYVERARKVLQFEQRTNHQDRAVRPGGLESFAVHWADEISAVCRSAGMEIHSIHRFTEYLEGYRQQDPMQRAASLRGALAILNELSNGKGQADGSATAKTTITPSGTTTPSKPVLSTHADRSNGKQAPGIPAAPSEPAVTPVARTKHTEQGAHVGERSRTQATQAIPEGRVASKPSEQKMGEKETKKPVPAKAPPPIRLDAGMSTGHTTLAILNADVTSVPGVGPTVAAKLRHLDVRTVRDLLLYFPREHRDYSKLEKIANLPFDEVVTTMGMIWEVETHRTSGGRTRTVATISDDTGRVRVSWFNQPYLQKQLKSAQGSYLVVTGVKQRFGNKIDFSVRSHELPDKGDLLNTGRLVPIYPLTEGLHAKTLRRFTKWVVDRYANMYPEHLPASIRMGGKLMPLPEAISQIHYPESEQALLSARRRLAFDELFLIQLGMQERRSRWQYTPTPGHPFKVDLNTIFIDPPPMDSETMIEAGAEEHKADESTKSTPPIGATLWGTVAADEPFEAALPFRFTEAQRRVIQEMCGDLAKDRPMCRLLQGDVGSGKTAVAASALFLAALNGFQSAIMAPTEILAEQHARSISDMLAPFGIRTVLLTGSLRAKERGMGRAALENGQAMVAIGTHALIQEDVNFERLGLVIIDEQHRFGVEQRDILRQKGHHPHMLVMTATPIPRTLALTLYGDLDVSAIDQLPPGRQKIITRWRSGARRNEAYTLIAHQVAEGRQAFIICPLIEESETLAAKAATSEYERLSREVFPNLRLGLVHGAMKPAEKDATMRHFRDHELDVLVATSVIEVGIDVPNASVMIIEDADRFGLSQLHQFRGRVGRGQHQSYCYVLSADASQTAQERLEIFQATDDGFRLAEQDLRLRGPGEFFGVRQSGVPELRVADLSDTPLIDLTRTLADKLWTGDPYLRKPEHAPLRERMHTFWQNFIGH